MPLWISGCSLSLVTVVVFTMWLGHRLIGGVEVSVGGSSGSVCHVHIIGCGWSLRCLIIRAVIREISGFGVGFFILFCQSFLMYSKGIRAWPLCCNHSSYTLGWLFRWPEDIF